MLDLNRKARKEEFDLLRKAVEGLDCVCLPEKQRISSGTGRISAVTKSVHWSEFCKHPWMSVTVKSNGELAMCMEDFDNEIILGDARKEALYDIWNGDKYKRFRLDHVNLTKGIKCSERCDMKMVGDLLPQ